MSTQVGVQIQSGPSPWRIIQQDEHGYGSIELAGQWKPAAAGDVDRGPHWVEARLVHESSGWPVSTALDWASADVGPDGSWHMTIERIPAGGLYRLETRVSRRNLPDERPLRGDYVHCLGVGDLWCIAGQSNASGTGAGMVDDPPEAGVHMFANDEQWKLATHPLEDATGTLHPITVTGIYHGHSPWLTFAKRVKARLGSPIGLIPTAMGGSPLQRWNPSEPGQADLYANMMDMIHKAGGSIRGIVWYQGESDCSPGPADSYLARFGQFVQSVRDDLGYPRLPILTAQINRTTTTSCQLSPPRDATHAAAAQRAWSTVREAQRQAARDIPGVYLVPTLDLSLSDNIHIAAPSEVVLGERFAQVAIGKVHGKEALDEFPELSDAQLSGDDGNELAMQFRHVSGGWAPVGPVEDFRVEDAQGQVPVNRVELGEHGHVRLQLARAPEGSVWLHAAYGADPLVRLCDANRRPIVAFSVQVPHRHDA